jgi:hypothetical protein
MNRVLSFSSRVGARVLSAFALAIVLAPSISHATDTKLEAMPAQLETRFALSALPTRLRDGASVYLLDPDKGYRLARQGTSGIACLVERTGWELADFRNDIYIPLCYDAAGTSTYLKVIMDAAALRASGMSAQALKAEIEERYRTKAYRAPDKPGLSYMVSPVMRTVGPPDMHVHTVAMPHLMFYAPGASNEEIGAKPDLRVPKSLQSPFIDRQGNAEQSYMIQMVGSAEKAGILRDEAALVKGLCAHRKILCLDRNKH